ncbi:MAG TPA: SAM-dependent methyltransferase [Candidatus Sulfotelmatobacter sp.]|nr:SAM-dependent methyltransferase [Candidatus Sulfotelmatobacter sp.]
MIELRRKIEAEIVEHGPIPFSRYMELCLYDPDFGYYSRNASQFGKAGDFYTSSDVHAVFGRLLARQFDEMWRVLGSPEPIAIRELGPGRGLFARDVLDWSEKKFPEFFQALRYELVEQSHALRARLEETLRKHLESGKAALATSGAKVYSSGEPSGATEVAGFQSSSSQCNPTQSSPTESRPAQLTPIQSGPTQSDVPQSHSTIVFGNEFFDAMPVEIISREGSLRIDVRNGRFVETWVSSSAEELEFLDRYSIHPEAGERVEISLASIAEMLGEATIECGFMVVIDYGYEREEQLAGRHRGTLKAIRQHSVSANPYEAPGEQDITADVNFTALAAIAEQSGFHLQKLITQSQFLLGIGEANQFADAFEDCRLPQEKAKVALQLKHLVTPAGMGEAFHVLVASKGVDIAKASGLAGLSFGRG